ncbi:FAD-dependent oxidoreductase [Nocardioides pacificus]
MSGERLVVVGNGMAAVRLVEELVANGYGGHVTVVGDEPHAPYNRILLSAVLEGTHALDALTLRDPAWYDEHGVDLRLGTRVLGIEREEREVVLVDGSRLGYDRLVLATGAIPTLPPIRGLVQPDGRLHPKVHAFRTMDDCLRLLGAVPQARTAVVVGGGLLGLQVARAMSVRGVATEVVEGTEHLLSSQVGAPGGAVLRRDLRRLGTEVYTGARAVRLTDEGLRLDNGYTLDTDLVVLTAGGRPSSALARGAGLMVRRGIVVGGHLESVTDDRIHAIGDCAEHRGRTTGFVSPAWEQASTLAAHLTTHLTGREVTWEGTHSVARLRATGLDVAVLGDPEHTDGEVVEVTNPLVGSHRKLVVSGGVIVAAALIGDLSRVGLLTQLYERRTVLGPHEPGELLMPERGPVEVVLDDDAEVCSCAGVSAGAVRACASLAQAKESTRATTGCGGCADVVQRLVGGACPPPGRAARAQAFSRP